MKKSIQQLAQELRMNFPGTYDRIADETLVELWLNSNPQIINQLDFGYPVPENLRKFADKQQNLLGNPLHNIPQIPPQPNYNPQGFQNQQYGNPQYNHGNPYGAGQIPSPPPQGAFPPNQGVYPQQPMSPYGMPVPQYEATNPLWKRVGKTLLILAIIWGFLVVAGNLYDKMFH